MAVYLVTGKLGSGKTLATVGRIRDYLNKGRTVATNLDLTLEKLVNPWAKKTKVIRLPDKPVVEDLENLPVPYTGSYDENKTGLIVLDECGTWFNTRDYRDKTRQPLINKLLHIRKAGWDVIFIIQHIEMIDKQVREGIGEHVVYCQRADRLALPFITPLFKIFGLNIRPPKLHVAIVKYGTAYNAPVVDRWVYNGNDLYEAYDTRQVFGVNDCEIHSLLSPYLVFGQYYSESQYAKDKIKNKIKKIKRSLQRARLSFFLIGALTAFTVNALTTKPVPQTVKETEQEKTQEITEQSSTETENVLDYVRINATIVTDTGHEFYFTDTRDSSSFNPENHGYKVRYRDVCEAQLISLNNVTTITCKPKLVKQAEKAA